MIRIALAVLVLELAFVSLITAALPQKPKSQPVVHYCISDYHKSFWPCSEAYIDVEA
jgi:hypothetical protein